MGEWHSGKSLDKAPLGQGFEYRVVRFFGIWNVERDGCDQSKNLGHGSVRFLQAGSFLIYS
jgi:hypothetical protein